jgi:hypothetical protein
MVIGWFRQFGHVRMPENIKENNPQPNQSAEPAFDSRGNSEATIRKH